MVNRMTVLYSVLHMLIDGVCAIAMLGWFCLGEEGYLNILLYNFCAFALQMPLEAMSIEEVTEEFVSGGEKAVHIMVWLGVLIGAVVVVSVVLLKKLKRK